MKFSIRFRAVLLFYVFFNALTFAQHETSGNESTKVFRRGKRHLDYLQKSRIFFRANVKSNIIKVNQLWAHSYGYRANYPIENDKAHRPFRRDVYESLQDLMDYHGFDGRSCVLKSFCEATKIFDSKGMLYKMFKLVFTLPEDDKHLYTDFDPDTCQNTHHKCPLSFNNISPYTDDL